MASLTAEEILYIHYRVTKLTGGTQGVRDLGLLQSAAARPLAAFAGAEMYPGIFSKAAALAHSIIQNHPFIDGNKRTGIAAAALFLRKGGFLLQVSQEGMVEFILAVAEGKKNWAELANWLEQNSSQSSKSQ